MPRFLGLGLTDVPDIGIMAEKLESPRIIVDNLYIIMFYIITVESKMSKKILFLIIALMIASSLYTSAYAEPLQLTVDTNKASYSRGESITVTVTVDNNSQNPVKVNGVHVKVFLPGFWSTLGISVYERTEDLDQVYTLAPTTSYTRSFTMVIPQKIRLSNLEFDTPTGTYNAKCHLLYEGEKISNTATIIITITG